MTQKTAVCLGGPKHSETVKYSGMPEFRVAKLPDVPKVNFRFPSPDEPPKVVEFEMGTYRLGTLLLPSRDVIEVFYWQGWDTQVAVNRKQHKEAQDAENELLDLFRVDL